MKDFLNCLLVRQASTYEKSSDTVDTGLDGLERTGDRMAATQAAKLGLTNRTLLRLSNPPTEWHLEVAHPEPAPDERDPVEVVIAFFREASALPEQMPGLAEQIYPAGTIWAAWPRRAGGHNSNITDQIVRASALSVGLVDVKVAALDADWSALKLVWRKHLQERR